MYLATCSNKIAHFTIRQRATSRPEPEEVKWANRKLKRCRLSFYTLAIEVGCGISCVGSDS